MIEESYEGYDPFVDHEDVDMDIPTTVRQWNRSGGEEKSTFKQIEGYKQASSLPGPKKEVIKHGFGYFTDYAWNKHRKEVTVTFVRPKTNYSKESKVKFVPISSIKLKELGFTLPGEEPDLFSDLLGETKEVKLPVEWLRSLREELLTRKQQEWSNEDVADLVSGLIYRIEEDG